MEIEIVVTKLTDEYLLKRACQFTTGGLDSSRVTFDKMYRCEHSPIRTQMFLIEMYNIPTFVSVHLVRHKIGVEHFVKSNRDDRGGNGTEDRYTPVNHMMFCNAQALINMSRKRLCLKAHAETQVIMLKIKQGVDLCDSYLAKYMVKECEYRNGCYELKSCGYWGEKQNGILDNL